MSIKRNTIICALLCMCIAATVVLAGCGSTSTNTASEATTAATVDSAKTDGIDYMARRLSTRRTSSPTIGKNISRPYT